MIVRLLALHDNSCLAFCNAWAWVNKKMRVVMVLMIVLQMLKPGVWRMVEMISYQLAPQKNNPFGHELDLSCTKRAPLWSTWCFPTSFSLTPYF